MEMLDEGTLPDPRKYRKMADAIRAQIDRGVLAPDPTPAIGGLATHMPAPARRPRSHCGRWWRRVS